MKLAFTKMQGAGNDFVVLDGVSQRLALTPAQLRQLADRHFGVGGDLTIRWQGGDNPVWMTGPAVAVFEGVIEIDES